MNKTRDCLQQGKIIAYPTEAVYGLACDPFNRSAVEDLCTLKNRPLEKGLILVAHDWSQIEALTKPIPEQRLSAVFSHWPGPVTWLFPASEAAPTWITGDSEKIALRISAHPVVQALTKELGPLVSTSANKTGQAPCTTWQQIENEFGDAICEIVAGDLGQLEKPTTIIDALSGDMIR